MITCHVEGNRLGAWEGLSRVLATRDPSCSELLVSARDIPHLSLCLPHPLVLPQLVKNMIILKAGSEYASYPMVEATGFDKFWSIPNKMTVESDTHIDSGFTDSTESEVVRPKWVRNPRARLLSLW